MVRQLSLYNQFAGEYVDKAKAIYWDGRNESGETVSSGIYFYSLQTGRTSQTRKLVIIR
jgi:flagellar hook assembly protein FlgD